MKKIKSIKENKTLYWIILIVVCCTFIFQAFSLAHHLPSRVDEGSFLIKGYYFISGKYKPFEDYGPWTNNMPLAYLIPGIPQYLIGPGLRTGRYFAIFIAATTLIGLWVLIYRLRGNKPFMDWHECSSCIAGNSGMSGYLDDGIPDRR